MFRTGRLLQDPRTAEQVRGRRAGRAEKLRRGRRASARRLGNHAVQGDGAPGSQDPRHSRPPRCSMATNAAPAKIGSKGNRGYRRRGEACSTWPGRFDLGRRPTRRPRSSIANGREPDALRPSVRRRAADRRARSHSGLEIVQDWPRSRCGDRSNRRGRRTDRRRVDGSREEPQLDSRR